MTTGQRTGVRHSDSTAHVVPVPVTVETRTLGAVPLARRPPRYPQRPNGLAEWPAVNRTEAGLRLGYLSERRGNRHTVVRMLEMLLLSAGGSSREGARQEAEQLVDDILEANLACCRRLESLIDTADEDLRCARGVPPSICSNPPDVAALQQGRLSWIRGT